jgi:hypothetical protein
MFTFENCNNSCFLFVSHGNTDGIATEYRLDDLVIMFRVQVRSRIFTSLPVVDLTYDSGRTLVRVEYGYAKGSPNTSS